MARRLAAPSISRTVRAGFGVGIILVLTALAASAQGAALEYAVEAVYVFKFAPFVEWPAGTFASPSAPLMLCIVGEDPIDPLLERAVSGQRVGTHPILFQRLRTVDAGADCQILYLAGSPAQSIVAALRAVQGRPVLTITDWARNDDAKGIVNFVVRDNHVRFEIDARAAVQNGLAISSKLLDLAVQVTQ